jgi:hypothetical protein
MSVQVLHNDTCATVRSKTVIGCRTLLQISTLAHVGNAGAAAAATATDVPIMHGSHWSYGYYHCCSSEFVHG